MKHYRQDSTEFLSDRFVTNGVLNSAHLQMSIDLARLDLLVKLSMEKEDFARKKNVFS